MSWQETFRKLETGELRAANKVEGKWIADQSVKQSILEAFKEGKMVQFGEFVDKDSVLPRTFTPADGVRIVPGGSVVRPGTYIASGVVIMAPAYVNCGAYVDEGTMVDSHALVGSCAQVGKRVHLSAGVQIGGVLEPIGQSPVVIEDDAFIGAGAVIVEGITVGKRAVIAPGVSLSASVPVYDCVNECQIDLKKGIPEGAVVVAGTRTPGDSRAWAKEQGLQLQCALIIKYRDAKSDAGLTLEEALR